MEKFRIGSLDYSPYNNHNKEHLNFLNSLLEEVENQGELEERLGDISYMFDHSYQELENFSLYNSNAYLVYDKESIIGFVYMYLNDLNELLLYMGIKDSFRRLGYASKITSELTDYILKNFAIKGIKVQVESDNIGSLKAIQKSGFEHLEDDFYIKR